MYVSLKVRVIAASKGVASRDSVMVISGWICDASTCLACARFVLALLQVIVMPVSGHTDTDQGHNQNNKNVSKKKKTMTASKKKEGEKKGECFHCYSLLFQWKNC